jgi:competence protein ComEA
LPEGNGRDLVQKVCNSCHSVDLITTHRQTRDEWTGTVQRMAQHGASATDEQFNEIVNYLTNNFGRTPDPKE